MDAAIIDCDLVLEASRPERQVKIFGELHKLRRAADMDDFMQLLAIQGKIEALREKSRPEEVGALQSGLDDLKAEMRGVIQALVPSLDAEAMEAQKLTMRELNRVMLYLMGTALDQLPESVKKKSESGLSRKTSKPTKRKTQIQSGSGK